MQAAVPAPLDSMDHDVGALVEHILRLPAIAPTGFFHSVARAVKRARDHLVGVTSIHESRSHYFNVMGTQSPTLDRSTGLECFAPARSIHGSHDLWRRSTHEAWELYPQLYGATAGAAWLTVLLQWGVARHDDDAVIGTVCSHRWIGCTVAPSSGSPSPAPRGAADS